MSYSLSSDDERRSSADSTLLGGISTDPFQWVPITITLFLGAFYVVALPEQYYYLVDYYLAELILMSLATALMAIAAIQAGATNSRWFWSILTFAFGSWLVARIASFALINAPAANFELLKDVLLLLMFSAMVLAIDLKLDSMQDRHWLQRRGPPAVGGVMIVFAIFGYFSVLPMASSDAPYRSSFALQAALDAYIGIRFFLAAYSCKKASWKKLYLHLGVVFALICLADGLAWLYRQDIIEYVPGSALNLLWYLWYPVAFIATRVNLDNHKSLVAPETLHSINATLGELLFYGLGLPFLHALGYAIFIFASGPDQVRDLSVAVWLFVMAGLLIGFYQLVRYRLTTLEEERLAAERNAHELERQLDRELRIRSLGRMAAGLAHDFGNSVTAIGLHARLIADEVDGDRIDPQVLTGLNSSITYAQDLIEKLRTFGASGDAVKAKPIDVSAEVAGTLDLLQPGLSEGVSIQRDLDDSPVLAIASRPSIHQITTNLLYNAIDAVGSSGTISVRVLREFVDTTCSSCGDRVIGQYVRLTVTDSGLGVDESIVETLFEPLITTKSVNVGSGLGLSIVHSVLHRISGHVEVTSDESGCTFDAYFLCADKSKAQPR